MTLIYVSSGQTLSNAMFDSGDFVEVLSGGEVVSATGPAFLEIESGGSAFAANLGSGYLLIESGGFASGITLGYDGYDNLAGGTESAATVENGGYLLVTSGGTATGDRIDSGGFANVQSGDLINPRIVMGAAIDVSPGGMLISPNYIACYCPGTLIRTDQGDVAVETLTVGDKVVTIDGRAELVRWIGRRSYAARFLRGRSELMPVRIRAGALGNGVPFQDLLVSPAHALFLDGVLVQAGSLLNGTTIVRETGLEKVDYIHIELLRHNLVWANGAAAETFVDDNSRAMFSNAADFAALYGDVPSSNGVFCAERVTDGYQLESIRRRLAELSSRAA